MMSRRTNDLPYLRLVLSIVDEVDQLSFFSTVGMDGRDGWAVPSDPLNIRRRI